MGTPTITLVNISLMSPTFSPEDRGKDSTPVAMPTWDASPPWLRPLGPPTRGKCDQNPATGFNLNPHASFDPNPPTSFEQSPAGSSNPNPPPTASFVQDPPTSFGQHSTASFEQNPPTSAAGPGPVRDENNNGSGSNHAGYSSHFSMVTFTSQSHNTANHTQVPPGLSIIVQPTRHHLGHRLALSVRPAGPRNNAMTMRSPSTALSTNYCGDARLVDNYSANIRPEESTSLFIKNLPAEATIPKILGSIRATGTVSSLHLNPRVPDPPAQWLRGQEDCLLFEGGGRQVLPKHARRFLHRRPPRHGCLEPRSRRGARRGERQPGHHRPEPEGCGHQGRHSQHCPPGDSTL